MPNKIDNPYSESPNLSRVQTWMDEGEYKFVRRVADGDGVVTAIINKLWSELVIELKKANITDFTQNERFINFVNNIKIISSDELQPYNGGNSNIPGTAITGNSSSGTTPAGHNIVDRTRLAGVRNKATRKKN